MKDFLFVNSWFDQKYQNLSGSRYATFKATLNLFRQNNGFYIVETGTTGQKKDWGAGYSTVLFGDYLSRYGGQFWTVDISEPNMNVCRVATAEYASVIDYVVSDSHLFLRTYIGKIDLLYLDSYDYPLDGSDPSPCQQHQLEELKLAFPHLHDKSIVLLDDNNFDNGGKTKLTKDCLIEKGWRCVLDQQQSLWIK